MSPEVAALAGAAISAATAVAVVGLQSRYQRKHDEWKETAARAARLGSSAHQIALRLGPVARSPSFGKMELMKVVEEMITTEFSPALSETLILDVDVIATAAFEVDRLLAELKQAALAKEWDRDEWRSQRAGFAETLDLFHRAARSQLGVKAPVPGRPSLLIASRQPGSGSLHQ